MKRIFLLLLLLVSAASVRAQQNPDSRIDTLETRVTTWEKIVSRLPRFSGYVQAGYQWADDASSCFLQRVRLSVAGDIAPKVDYKIQFEFTNPRLVDAYIRYKPLKELNIQLGQYKVPFSIENTEYVPTKLEFTEYPLVLRKLIGFGEDISGLSATGRDIGATLSGGFIEHDGFRIINYDLSVFDGAGLNRKDDNKSKDFAARLTIKPLAGLQIAGSYYYGETGADSALRERYAVGICYARDAWVARGEWIGGRTGVKSRRYASDGWYAMVGWRAPRNFMPVARFETFTQDRDRWTATTQNNYTVGLLYAPFKYLRCQLDYTFEDYKAPGTDRNVVSLMITGMF